MESILKNLAKSQPSNILLEVSNNTTSIYIGETEIKIATCKMTSLISFLSDKDEDRLESSRFEIVPVNLERFFSLIQSESGKCKLLKKEKQKIERCRLRGCPETILGSRFVAKPCKCEYTFKGKSLYFTEISQDESTLRGTVSDVSSDETVDGNDFENTSIVSKRSTNSSSNESNTSIASTKRSPSAPSSVEKKSPSSGKKVPNSGKKSPPSAKDLAKSPPTKILMEVSNNTTSIHIGETEKKIATSKLTSLISSLLDKDEDRPHSFHGKKSSTSPEKSTSGSKSSVTSVSAGSNTLPEKSEKIVKITKIQEIPASSMGTSPANFSFLSDFMKEKENNENVGGKTLPDKLEIDPVIRERSHSASKLNDIKKIHQRMVSEGSSENSPLVSQSGTSSSDTGSEKVIPETEEDDDDSNKAKYRRCSSLRSGKTPPGTPGRRKIVR